MQEFLHNFICRIVTISKVPETFFTGNTDFQLPGIKYYYAQCLYMVRAVAHTSFSQLLLILLKLNKVIYCTTLLVTVKCYAKLDFMITFFIIIDYCLNAKRKPVPSLFTFEWRNWLLLSKYIKELITFKCNTIMLV